MLNRRFLRLLGVTLAMMTCASFPAAAGAPDGWRSSADGNTLYKECAKPDRSSCNGFITGVVSAISMSMTACWAKFPPGVVGNQIEDVVITGLKDHPEERQKSADYLIWKYVAAAWPCKS